MSLWFHFHVPFLTRFSQALWLFLALAVRLILETEYKVRVLKHTYKQHIVLQFEVMGDHSF